MGSTGQDAVEALIREASLAGQHDRAATLIVEHYGPELLGYLVGVLREEEQAAEVFSVLGEALWQSLPAFRWQCSARSWAYTLARHAISSHVKQRQRRRRRLTSLPERDTSALAMRPYTSTASCLKDAIRLRVRALRERLAPDDRSLLILRVDRGLPWHDLAIVFARGGANASEDILRRESARLRKRFQLITEQLRKLAIEEGLMGNTP